MQRPTPRLCGAGSVGHWCDILAPNHAISLPSPPRAQVRRRLPCASPESCSPTAPSSGSPSWFRPNTSRHNGRWQRHPSVSRSTRSFPTRRRGRHRSITASSSPTPRWPATRPGIGSAPKTSGHSSCSTRSTMAATRRAGARRSARPLKMRRDASLSPARHFAATTARSRSSPTSPMAKACCTRRPTTPTATRRRWPTASSAPWFSWPTPERRDGATAQARNMRHALASRSTPRRPPGRGAPH